ncbi:MAG: RNA polymerase sigma factor [Minisyncoccota bacterium]
MTIDEAKNEFTNIYKKEHNVLFRFCYFRVSDREKALEITQEAFTKLWVQMASGKTMENSKAFVYTVARHLIIDWYKKIKTRSLESLAKEDGVELDQADENSFSDIETSSDAKRIIAMMSKMNQKYRDVIYLRFIEDLPPRDIAKTLKLNANVVSIRITRGLEILRKSLGINNE